MEKESASLVSDYIDSRSCCCLLSSLVYKAQIEEESYWDQGLNTQVMYDQQRRSHSLTFRTKHSVSGVNTQTSSRLQDHKFKSVVSEKKPLDNV